ncbi:MAG: peptide deformylase [Firmicutes bacterium]|nr:peptide deformylase [Bacillota bacterium]
MEKSELRIKMYRKVWSLMEIARQMVRLRRIKLLFGLIAAVVILANYYQQELTAKRVGLTILEVDDPILHQVAAKVDYPEPSDREAIKLIKTYLEKKPLGLAVAAPQVGLSRQFFVIKDGAHVYALFNPRIVNHSQTVEWLPEKCLSIPFTVKGVIPRYTEVTVTGLNEDFQPVTIEAAGLQARIIQHEIDHLQGITILERVVPQQPELLKPLE